MSQEWTDLILGERMRVDQEFAPRVQQSEFSSQQWSLIMTAIEFEIENPGDPEAARIVTNTTSLPHIMPELDNIEQQMAAMGGQPAASDSGGGFFSGLLDAIGLGGGGGDDERLEAAERLTQEYADLLQAHLETQGKWERVREAAASAETDD